MVVKKMLRSLCGNLTKRTRYGFQRNFATTKVSDLQDEYGDMSNNGDTYRMDQFQLESGVMLHNVEVNYSTYGTLNKSKDNVLFVCHALSGNSALDSWWGGLLGDGNAFDTSKYFVVCANVLGSCYGTSGPTSINPRTGKQYKSSFPNVTVRDTVNLHKDLLRVALGIKQVQSVIGGSLGGMQALEWGLLGGNFVRSIIPIACGSHHSAWQIAISEVQRQAIYADPNWQAGEYDDIRYPDKGLALARQIAMISYRTFGAYQQKYGRSRTETKEFQVESYLHYQGEKFLSRFDANSYLCLTKLMDTHDVGRDRGGISKALGSIKQNALILGIDSDVLYPLPLQEELASKIPNAILKVIHSDHGHDGFLLEQDIIRQWIREFLNENQLEANLTL